jgi:hypothetical protein
MGKEKLLFRIKIGNHLIDDEVFKFMNIRYKVELEEAEKDHRLIRTFGLHRTGKTTALIEYAIERNHNVIVVDYKTSVTLREKFNYKKIYCKKSYAYISHSQSVVIDDDVFLKHTFRDITDFRFPVVTGYIPYDLSDEAIENMNSRVGV